MDVGTRLRQIIPNLDTESSFLPVDLFDAPVLINESTLLHNHALTSGGGVFAQASELLRVRCRDAQESAFQNLDSFDPEVCGWVNNTVSGDGYGDMVATVPVDAILDPSGIDNHTSGVQLANVTVTIVDAVGQTVTTGDTLVKVNLSANSTAKLFGQRASQTRQGQAVFDGTFLRARPGAYELRYTFGLKKPVALPVVVRACRIGEIQSEDRELCLKCQTGLYSFDTEGKCLMCPSQNAICNGSTITPLEGYWHSTSRSIQVHECLQAEACTYDGRGQALLDQAKVAHAMNETLEGDAYPQCAEVRAAIVAVEHPTR